MNDIEKETKVNILNDYIDWAEHNGCGYMLSLDNPLRVPMDMRDKAIKYLKDKYPNAEDGLISEIVDLY